MEAANAFDDVSESAQGTGYTPTNAMVAPSNTYKQKSVKDCERDYGYVSSHKVSEYTLIDDCYFATGGIKTNSYLVPFQIEEYYEYRKEYSHYINFFRPIIDAMVRPVFTEEPARSSSGVYAEEFFKNADGQGTAFTELVKSGVCQLRRHSVVYACVGNVAKEEMPATAQEAIEQRAFPFVYMRTQDEVVEGGLKTDHFGNVYQITFRDGKVLLSDNKTEVDTFRRVNKSKQVRFYLNDKLEEIILSSSDSPGILPVVIFRESLPGSRDKFVPEPKQLALAKACLALYNKDSEMRENERKQQFAILTCQGTPGDIGAGSGSLLSYPMEAKNAPGYTQPDPATLAGLLANRNSLKEDIYMVAEQSGVVAVNGTKEAKSGIALKLEFRAHNSVLEETAKFATLLENGIMKIFYAYTNEKSSFEVVYSNKFMPTDDAGQLAEDTLMLQEEKLPKTLFKMITESYFWKRFPDADKSAWEQISAEIDASYMDKEKSLIDDDFRNSNKGDE